MAANETPLKDDKIAIIGSGLIGSSFAMLFASAGYPVVLYDKMEGQVEKAQKEIDRKFRTLAKQGLLRGTLSVEVLNSRISGTDDIQQCVQDAMFIQESVQEELSLKLEVWTAIDLLKVKDDVIMSSTTSAIVPSLINEKMSHKSRFIVSHPTNPPFYCPLVEVIPSACTDQDVVDKTMSLMLELGQEPVLIKKELKGFVLNRIQYALMGECWRLIRDGVISVSDCDKVMSSGLGMRYAFIGPFETAYLNADGFKDYCDRYSDMIYAVQQDMGPPEVMAGQVASLIHDSIGAKFGGVQKVPERRQWRDDRLISLAKLKKE